MASFEREETLITRYAAPPRLIVALASRGPLVEAEPGLLVLERILRDTRWAIKGIARKEYTSEIIETSSLTGVHRVGRVRGPSYVQGDGGMSQVFRHITEHPELFPE